MSKISMILEADAEGFLRVPLPPELRYGKLKIDADVQRIEPVEGGVKPGIWKNLPKRVWIAPDFDAPLDDFKEYRE